MTRESVANLQPSLRIEGVPHLQHRFVLPSKKGLISDEKGEADTDVEFGMDFS